MTDDLTAVKRLKIDRNISTGLIRTDGMGGRTVNGKEASAKTPEGNLVLEKAGKKESKPTK